jgi:hypothetical protein
MLIKNIFLVLILLFSLNSIYALEGDSNFKFLNFYIDSESQTNKVSYELTYDENLRTDDVFQVEMYYEGDLVDDNCVKDLIVSSEILFTKFVCDVPKSGFGEYTFIGKILRDGQEINVDLSKHYLEEEGNLFSLTFDTSLEDKTIINIELNSEGEDLLIKSRIPKNVIEILNDENKESLIYSELEYEILEEDPLIAWSVDRAPTKINYTINKKVSNEDLQDFRIEVEDSLAFKGLNYILIFVILLIIFLVFKPLINRIKK